MVLRVRFARGRRAPGARGNSIRWVVAAYSVLQPVAIAAWCLAGWRLGIDLGWSTRFPVRSGPLSHWQAWIAGAFTIQFAAYLLQRWMPLPDHRESTRVHPHRPQAGVASSSSYR